MSATFRFTLHSVLRTDPMVLPSLFLYSALRRCITSRADTWIFRESVALSCLLQLVLLPSASDLVDTEFLWVHGAIQLSEELVDGKGRRRGYSRGKLRQSFGRQRPTRSYITALVGSLLFVVSSTNSRPLFRQYCVSDSGQLRGDEHLPGLIRVVSEPTEDRQQPAELLCTRGRARPAHQPYLD